MIKTFVIIRLGTLLSPEGNMSGLLIVEFKVFHMRCKHYLKGIVCYCVNYLKAYVFQLKIHLNILRIL